MWSTKEMEAAEWMTYCTSRHSVARSCAVRPSSGSPRSPFTTTSFRRTCLVMGSSVESCGVSVLLWPAVHACTRTNCKNDV